MLNGTSPVLFFNFGNIEVLGFSLPLLSVPVYLDENLTGVLVDSHERVIDVAHEVDANYSYEKVLSSGFRITLKGRKNNIYLTAFIALFELALKYVPDKAYKIMFFYDDIFLTDACLKSFNANVIENTDTRVVSFVVEQRPEKKSIVGKTKILHNTVPNVNDIKDLPK